MGPDSGRSIEARPFPHPVTGQQELSAEAEFVYGVPFPILALLPVEVVLPTDFKGLFSLLLLPTLQGCVPRNFVFPLPGVTASLKGTFDLLVASGTLWRTRPVQSLLSSS